MNNQTREILEEIKSINIIRLNEIKRADNKQKLIVTYAQIIDQYMIYKNKYENELNVLNNLTSDEIYEIEADLNYTFCEYLI